MSRPAVLPPATIDALKAILGPGGWLDAPSDRAPFETDFRGLHHGTTPLVALPDSTARVSGLVGFCARERIASSRRAATPVIAAARRRGRPATRSCFRCAACGTIRAVDAANDSLTAEAGCVLAELQSAGRRREPPAADVARLRGQRDARRHRLDQCRRHGGAALRDDARARARPRGRAAGRARARPVVVPCARTTRATTSSSCSSAPRARSVS